MKTSLLIWSLIFAWFVNSLFIPGTAMGKVQNIELLKTLEVSGGFIRLESQFLFLTSSVKMDNATGYWFDIGKNPSTPTLVNSTLPGAWDIAVVGDYAYICDYTKFLTVYDIHDHKWEQAAKIPMPSMTENIIIRGNFAYIANHRAGLTIVDIQKPLKPVIVANYNPDIDCDAIGLWKNSAILYGHHESCLVLVNVQDPRKIVKTGVYQHAAKTFIQGEMAVENGFAYCTAGKNGLAIVNITDPVNPALVKVVDITDVRDVIIKGQYAFIAAGNMGVYVFDVSMPFAPVELGYYKCNAIQLDVHRSDSNSINSVPKYFIYIASKKKPMQVLLFHAPKK